mgnify:CR=1 FL=1
MQTFYSHGKLLISAEYAVLDGALALALPTKFGQSLSVESNSENTILWKSISNEGIVWFEAVFKILSKSLESIELSHILDPESTVIFKLPEILGLALITPNDDLYLSFFSAIL